MGGRVKPGPDDREGGDGDWVRPEQLYRLIVRHIANQLRSLHRPRRRPAHRREEIDEIPVGVPEQPGAVAPGLGGRRQGGVVDRAGETRMGGVDILDAKFDEDGVVVGGPRGAGAEHVDGAGAGDRQRRGRRLQFGEVIGLPGRREAGHPGVELHQALDVVGDDAGRDELHFY